MSYTFRQISSRSGFQGGGSFQNITVNNNIKSIHSFVVFGNDPLNTIVFKSLLNNTTLIDNVAPNLRNFIEREELNRPTFDSILLPLVSTSLLTNTTPLTGFVDQVLNNLLGIFVSATTTTTILEDIDFIDSLLSNLEIYGYMLYNINLKSTIRNFIFNNLLINVTFNLELNKLIARFFTQNNFLYNFPAENSKTLYSFTIPGYMLYKNVSVLLFKTTLLKNSSATFKIQNTVFGVAFGTISRITIAVYNDSTFSLMKVLYDTTYTSPITSITLSLSDIIVNNSTNENITTQTYVTCEVNNNVYATCTGSCLVNKALNVDVANVMVESLLTLSPINESINIYNSSNQLIQTIASPNNFYNGFLQYSLRNPVWFINIQYTLAPLFKVNTNDKNILYMACGVNGPVTVNTSPVLRIPYSGGRPIVLFRFNITGIVVWSAVISSVSGSSFDIIDGIVADKDKNVYVFGRHTCGPALYGFKAGISSTNVTLIDDTPLIDPISGVSNETNAFIVKYDSLGNVLGRVIIVGEGVQKINGLSIDSTTNAVCIAGSTTATGDTKVVGFNQIEWIIPNVGQGFFLRLNNVGQTNLDEFVGTVTPKRLIDPFADPLVFVFDLSAGFTEGAHMMMNNSGNMYFLYTSLASLVQVSSVFDYTDNSNLGDSGVMGVAKYTVSGDYVYDGLITLRIFNWTNDKTQQFYVDSVGSTFVTVRTTGPVTVYGTEGLTTFTLDQFVTLVDINFLFKFVDKIYFNGSTVLQYAQISNSSIIKMTPIDDKLFVEFSFFDVCKVIVPIIGSQNGQYDELTIGQNGKKGNCIVMFQQSNLTPTLIGYTMNNI